MIYICDQCEYQAGWSGGLHKHTNSKHSTLNKDDRTNNEFVNPLEKEQFEEEQVDSDFSTYDSQTKSVSDTVDELPNLDTQIK